MRLNSKGSMTIMLVVIMSTVVLTSLSMTYIYMVSRAKFHARIRVAYNIQFVIESLAQIIGNARDLRKQVEITGGVAAACPAGTYDTNVGPSGTGTLGYGVCATNVDPTPNPVGTPATCFPLRLCVPTPPVMGIGETCHIGLTYQGINYCVAPTNRVEFVRAGNYARTEPLPSFEDELLSHLNSTNEPKTFQMVGFRNQFRAWMSRISQTFVEKAVAEIRTDMTAAPTVGNAAAGVTQAGVAFPPNSTGTSNPPGYNDVDCNGAANGSVWCMRLAVCPPGHGGTSCWTTMPNMILTSIDQLPQALVRFVNTPP